MFIDRKNIEITVTISYISFKRITDKTIDLGYGYAYTYYLNLVEAMIRH